MKTYTIYYTWQCPVTGLHEAGAFVAQADNLDHAVEQVLNAYSGAWINWAAMAEVCGYEIAQVINQFGDPDTAYVIADQDNPVQYATAEQAVRALSI